MDRKDPIRGKPIQHNRKNIQRPKTNDYITILKRTEIRIHYRQSSKEHYRNTLKPPSHYDRPILLNSSKTRRK